MIFSYSKMLMVGRLKTFILYYFTYSDIFKIFRYILSKYKYKLGTIYRNYY